MNVPNSLPPAAGDTWARRLRLTLEMIRFSHTIFALPFALLAAAMAWKAPVPPGSGAIEWVAGAWLRLLLGILVCMVAARSAAMAFNRIVDRQYDAQNPRTAGRHLPRGDLSLAWAGGFTLFHCILFVLGTLLFWPNWLPLVLSGPVLAVLLGYSYAKRFTALAHYWLGVALMLAPLAAWIALRGPIVIQQPADLLTPTVLGLAVFFWVGGFDIIYACQDQAADRRAGLHSIPAWLGTPLALRWAAISHGLSFLALLLLAWVAPPELGLSWLYLGTVLMIGGLLVYQHALVRPDDLSRVNIAFFNVNAVISSALLLMGLIDLWFVN